MILPSIVASTADSAVIAPNRFVEPDELDHGSLDHLERHRHDAGVDHVELARRGLATDR